MPHRITRHEAHELHGKDVLIALVLGGSVAWLGYSRVPKRPLEHTRQHVEDDVKHLKEHLA